MSTLFGIKCVNTITMSALQHFNYRWLNLKGTKQIRGTIYCKLIQHSLTKRNIRNAILDQTCCPWLLSMDSTEISGMPKAQLSIWLLIFIKRLKTLKCDLLCYIKCNFFLSIIILVHPDILHNFSCVGFFWFLRFKPQQFLATSYII